jgi:hypothetical protein
MGRPKGIGRKPKGTKYGAGQTSPVSATARTKATDAGQPAAAWVSASGLPAAGAADTPQPLFGEKGHDGAKLDEKNIVSCKRQAEFCPPGILQDINLDAAHVSEGEKRVAIKVMYVCTLNSPPPEEWGDGDGAVAFIASSLEVHDSAVLDVLERVWEGIELGTDVDVYPRRHGTGGQNKRIKKGSKAADLLIGSLTNNFGERLTSHRLADQMGEPMSKSTVHNTKARLQCLVSRRQTCKTGSADTAKQWSRSRHTICTQFVLQIMLAIALGAVGDTRYDPLVDTPAPSFATPAWFHSLMWQPRVQRPSQSGCAPPRYLDGTFWCDEHCETCVIGGSGHNARSGSFEHRFPMKDGQHCYVEDGGVYGPKLPRIKPKYDQQASGIFMCAAVTRSDNGKREGRKGVPMRYKKWIVGVKKYNLLLQLEFKRVRGLKTMWTADEKAAANPYIAKWGSANWESKLPVKFKWMCITDLMDHVVEQGNVVFKGTTREHDWVIYHDRLSQWWEEESQEYLETQHHMRDRQWKAVGSTNDSLPKYYKNSLMGDSPELMPLDSSLFNDLIDAVGAHVSATWEKKELDPKGTHWNDKKKFKMSTPDEAWATMEAVWLGSDAVRSERIIDDVDKVQEALEAIVKAEGAVVHSHNGRKGHRACSHRTASKSISTGGRMHRNAIQGMLEQVKLYEGLSGSAEIVFS